MEQELTQLSTAEKFLVEKTTQGETADLTLFQDDKEIRADVLRRLILGLPIPSNNGEMLRVPLTGRGIHLKGAQLIGELKAQYACGLDGLSANPIVLEECDCINPIYLDHARLKFLSLKNCRITHFSANNSRIEGRLELSGLVSAEVIKGFELNREGGCCWVELRGSHLGGGLLMKDSKLYLPVKARGRESILQGYRYALDCTSAQIDERMTLQPNFQANGGVSICDAHIFGDVWACGAELMAGDGYALQGQGVQIEGYLSLGSLNFDKNDTAPFVSRGSIHLFGARVRQAVYMQGAKIQEAANQSQSNLIMVHASIGQDLKLIDSQAKVKGENQAWPFEIQGYVNLENLQVGGSINIVSSNISALGSSIWANNASIGKDFILRKVYNGSRCSVGGGIFLEGISVGGNLEISGVNLTSLSSFIQLKKAKIEGDVRLSPKVSGTVSFEGSHISGDLFLGTNDDPLEFMEGGSTSTELSLEGITIDGTLKVHNLKVPKISDNLKGSTKKALNKLIDHGELKKARSYDFNFYPGWMLVECLYKVSEQQNVVSFLWNSGTRQSLVLTGASSLIHSLNGSWPLRLTNASAAADYLRFFCMHVWGEEGAFRIIEAYSDMENTEVNPEILEKITPLTIRQEGNIYIANATVHYGNTLYRSCFRIEGNGSISMSEDEPIAKVDGTIRYSFPFRQPKNQSQDSDKWPVPPAISGNWQELDLKTAEEIVRNTILRKENDQWPRIGIYLRGASIGILDDQHGRAWGLNVEMFLEGISLKKIIVVYPEYNKKIERLTDKMLSKIHSFPLLIRMALVCFGFLFNPLFLLVALMFRGLYNLITLMFRVLYNLISPLISWITSNLLIKKSNKPSWWIIFQYYYGGYCDGNNHPFWQWRQWWLTLQYSGYEPTSLNYTPQPYNEIARIYRAQGHHKEAIRLTTFRLNAERQVKTFWLLKPLLWVFSLGFGYGLSPPKAITSLLLCIVVGWLGTDFANHNNLLILDTTPTATLVVQEAGQEGTIRFAPATLMADKTAVRTLIPCEDAISPLLFATDVFIPLLDLRQEFRCQVRSFDPEIDDKQKNICMLSSEKGVIHTDIFANLVTYSRCIANKTLYDPRTWLLIHSMYSIIGWIVTSLVILTISGVLRRQAENE